MGSILTNLIKFCSLLFPFLETSASDHEIVIPFHATGESNYKFVVLNTYLVLTTGDYVDFVKQFKFHGSLLKALIFIAVIRTCS